MGTRTREPAPTWLTRGLNVAVLVGAAWYLAWRLTTLGSGPTLLLSVPLLALELWGWLAFAVFTASAWRGPGPPPRPVDHETLPPVDVVVDARHRSVDQLERTLVGLKMLRGAGEVLVLLDRTSRETDALFARFPAATGIVSDRPAMAHVADAESTVALWLEAGQITMPDLLDASVPRLRAGVATCQVAVGWLDANSMARLRSGRDQSTLMQQVIGPSLSRRGVALWDGVGSLIRTAALRSVPFDDTTTPAHVRTDLLAAGWQTAYEPRDLIRGVAPTTLVDYLAQRRIRTAREWQAAWSVGGALRPGRPDLARRLGPLHHLLAASAGLRLLLLAAFAAIVVVSGTLPFAADAVTVARPWLALTVAATLARRLTAGPAMAIGDWIRQAWRTLPADGPALLRPSRHAVVDDVGPRAGRLDALGPLWLLSIAMLVLDVALLVRGWDLIRPDTLPSFAGSDRVVVVLWTLGLLVPLADVVITSARRRERRRSPRMGASLPVTLNGIASRCVDISPNGMGVLADHAPEVGARIMFWLTLPALGGGETHITGAARVRHATTDEVGRVRIGLEYDELTHWARASLIAYCGVGHAIEFADDDPILITPAELDIDLTPAGRPMGVLTGVAASIGVAVVLAGPTATVAVAEEIPPLESVCVVTVDGDPIAGAVVHRAVDGTEEVLGSTDATGCLAVAQPIAPVTFRTAVGPAEAAADSSQTDDGTLHVVVAGSSVTVLDPSGAPTDATVRVFTDGWNDAGPVEGTIVLPLDPALQAVEVRWNDITHVTELDAETVVVLARLVDDGSGTVVEIDRGLGWEPFTGSMEALPGRLAVRLADGRIVKLDVPADHEVALPSGATRPLGVADTWRAANAPTEPNPPVTSTTTAPNTTTTEPPVTTTTATPTTTTTETPPTTTTTTEPPSPTTTETPATTEPPTTSTTAATSSTTTTTTTETPATTEPPTTSSTAPEVGS